MYAGCVLLVPYKKYDRKRKTKEIFLDDTHFSKNKRYDAIYTERADLH